MLREFRPPPGIRVVRTLARERHTERLLVQLDDDGDTGPAEVIRAVDDAGAGRVRRAIVALDRMRDVGLGGLLDVFDDQLGPAILLAHERGSSLSHVLLTRARWQAGEAVGLLAPLADAVERMHDAGVAHGGLSEDHVIVTPTGPALTGFHAAELFDRDAPEALRETIEEVACDREALRRIATAVLARIEGSRMAAAGDLLERLTEVPGHRLASFLTSELAQLAAPQQVAMVAPEAKPVDEVRQPRPAEHVPPGPPLTSAMRVLSGLNGDAVVAVVREQLDRMLGAIRSLPSGRRRLMIGGGAAIGLAALLLAMIPPDADSAVAPVAHPDPTSSASGAAAGQQAGVKDPGRQDDPAQALVALLQHRERCFRELSVLCLDQVDQLGSAALATDRAALLAMRDGDEGDVPMVDPVSPRVIERLGDSALIEIGPETAPASLLVMRSEAGWRIRDWIAGG